MVREGLLMAELEWEVVDVPSRGPIACNVRGKVYRGRDGRILGWHFDNAGTDDAEVVGRTMGGEIVYRIVLSPSLGLAVPINGMSLLEPAMFEAHGYRMPRPPRVGLCRFRHERERWRD